MLQRYCCVHALCVVCLHAPVLCMCVRITDLRVYELGKAYKALESSTAALRQELGLIREPTELRQKDCRLATEVHPGSGRAALASVDSTQAASSRQRSTLAPMEDTTRPKFHGQQQSGLQELALHEQQQQPRTAKESGQCQR